MTKLLIALFVKNKEDILNSDVRKAYGTLTGTVGICCNIFLFIIKFAAGIITSSISITADAFNNLSDAGSSIVTLIGFRMAGKPADTDHPYGHGRIEYISGLIIAFAILLMGFELFKTSLDKIIHPTEITFSWLSAAILIVSILVKLWIALFNRKIGKKLNASAMLAVAADSINDSIATTAVLTALLINLFVRINIDGYAGLLVALFVLYSGYNTAKDTIEPLLGQAPDPDFVKDIEECIVSHDEIVGIHDVIVHDYGPGRVIVSLHAEIPCNMNFMHAHDVIDSIEDEVRKKFNCQISIHMDPIATDDEVINGLKTKVTDIVKSIDPRFRIHDFRITDGPLRKNMIFDIEVPFDFKSSDDIVKSDVTAKIKKIDQNFYTVINIDRVS